MKLSINIILCVAGISLLYAFASPEKKLNKLVSKIWKEGTIEMNAYSLPDSIQKDVQQFNEVIVDGNLKGYACYTTAFGCRIGGCAAPTNPNVQSYETFDYMVIYDTNLSIIKVEVAEYSGQYGYEICRAKWLEQFIGSTLGFELNKNVDGISGATISAQYLIDDLNGLGKKLQSVLLQSI